MGQLERSCTTEGEGELESKPLAGVEGTHPLTLHEPSQNRREGGGGGERGRRRGCSVVLRAGKEKSKYVLTKSAS